jgi:hypothetical protein
VVVVASVGVSGDGSGGVDVVGSVGDSGVDSGGVD